MKYKLSAESRRKMSEGQKRRHALKKENENPKAYNMPVFDPKPLEFSGTFEANTGTLTITFVLGRYASMMTSMMETAMKFQ